VAELLRTLPHTPTTPRVIPLPGAALTAQGYYWGLNPLSHQPSHAFQAAVAANGLALKASKREPLGKATGSKASSKRLTKGTMLVTSRQDSSGSLVVNRDSSDEVMPSSGSKEVAPRRNRRRSPHNTGQGTRLGAKYGRHLNPNQSSVLNRLQRESIAGDAMPMHHRFNTGE